MLLPVCQTRLWSDSVTVSQPASMLVSNLLILTAFTLSLINVWVWDSWWITSLSYEISRIEQSNRSNFVWHTLTWHYFYCDINIRSIRHVTVTYGMFQYYETTLFALSQLLFSPNLCREPCSARRARDKPHALATQFLGLASKNSPDRLPYVHTYWWCHLFTVVKILINHAICADHCCDSDILPSQLTWMHYSLWKRDCNEQKSTKNGCRMPDDVIRVGGRRCPCEQWCCPRTEPRLTNNMNGECSVFGSEYISPSADRQNVRGIRPLGENGRETLFGRSAGPKIADRGPPRAPKRARCVAGAGVSQLMAQPWAPKLIAAVCPGKTATVLVSEPAFTDSWPRLDPRISLCVF